jgi:hypothetical protein
MAACLTLVFVSASLLVAKERPTADRAKPTNRTSTDARTGVTFPKQVGSFERQGSMKYDDEGYPTASYATESLIFADVFYYKGDPFPVEYANARAAVKEGDWHARLISDEHSNLRPSGRRSIFTFVNTIRSEKVPFMTELVMFPHHGYFLKFRIDYPAAVKDHAQQEIEAFVRGFPLP